MDRTRQIALIRCLRIAVVLGSAAAAESTLGFSERNSSNTTLDFEVVIPAVLGMSVGNSGRIAVVSNGGQLAINSARPESTQRSLPLASFPPDYSSEIDIQTFDIDPGFRFNPTLDPSRRTARLKSLDVQVISVSGQSTRGGSSVFRVTSGSATIAAP